MPHLPDKLVMKERKELQTNLYIFAWLIGLGGLVALFNGSGGGFIAMMIGYGIGFVASKIKTEKHFQGGGGLYK